MVSKTVSFQHVINIKKLGDILCFLFFFLVLFLKSGMYFMLIIHLNFDEPQFKGSVNTWLPSQTAQPSMEQEEEKVSSTGREGIDIEI